MVKACSMKEIKEEVLLIVLLSGYRSKNQHSGEQVIWETWMTISLFEDEYRKRTTRATM